MPSFWLLYTASHRADSTGWLSSHTWQFLTQRRRYKRCTLASKVKQMSTKTGGRLFVILVIIIMLDYFSIDTVVDSEESVYFSTEFFNSQTRPCISPHEMSLKVWVLVKFLNFYHIWYRTRFRVISLTQNIIEAKMLTGCVKTKYFY